MSFLPSSTTSTASSPNRFPRRKRGGHGSVVGWELDLTQRGFNAFPLKGRPLWPPCPEGAPSQGGHKGRPYESPGGSQSARTPTLPPLNLEPHLRQQHRKLSHG